MHITVLAHGSRGDVQPYVALGPGLEDAGSPTVCISFGSIVARDPTGMTGLALEPLV